MCKPLGAGGCACTWGCCSKCWQIKGEVNNRYHLTLWPTLKHCLWMDGTQWQKCQVSRFNPSTGTPLYIVLLKIMHVPSAVFSTALFFGLTLLHYSATSQWHSAALHWSPHRNASWWVHETKHCVCANDTLQNSSSFVGVFFIGIIPFLPLPNI